MRWIKGQNIRGPIGESIIGPAGKDANPLDIVPLVIKKLPKPEELKPEKLANALNEKEGIIEQKTIKGLSDELRAIKQNIRSKTKQAGGGGIAGTNITADQFTGDGSTKTFTLTKTLRKALVLVCSDSPISYRLTTDYTASGTILTLTAEVGAPSSGATITFLYISA